MNVGHGKGKSLECLLIDRSSKRDFSNEPISYEELSYITYFSLGIKDDSKSFDETRRMYPSAGARYPIEAYIIVSNVKNFDEGLYHYNVKENSFESLISGVLDYNPSSPDQTTFSNQPNVTFILTAVIPRNEVKYGNNAYRFAMLEAGHIGQNIYLTSESQGLGCCALGMFDNDKISKLLDIAEDELPLYILLVGKTKL